MDIVAHMEKSKQAAIIQVEKIVNNLLVKPVTTLEETPVSVLQAAVAEKLCDGN